jgi:hypothetical protein
MVAHCVMQFLSSKCGYQLYGLAVVGTLLCMQFLCFVSYTRTDGSRACTRCTDAASVVCSSSQTVTEVSNTI